ncbi:MAG TPA: SiaB family protein kinase [Burkholderiales bacterium]|nr:SiaB family protein kinase [Burkholderiales bacterium]
MNIRSRLMDLEGFSQFRDTAQQQGILFFYNGYFSQNIIAAMADAVRHRLESQAEKGSTMRKVFSTFIEMAQNIIHYSADNLTDENARDREMRFGTVTLGRQGESYFVVCGNVVPADAVSHLSEKLNSIRSMSSDEIKAAYRETLRSESESGSKGAGLGLLTMARDSTQPIEYSFVNLPEEGNAFFYLRAII